MRADAIVRLRFLVVSSLGRVSGSAVVGDLELKAAVELEADGAPPASGMSCGVADGFHHDPVRRGLHRWGRAPGTTGEQPA